MLQLLSEVLVAIRILGFQGKSEQVHDLADAFHNLPIYLESEDFSFRMLRDSVKSYQRKYPSSELYDFFNFLERLDRIIENEDLWKFQEIE